MMIPCTLKRLPDEYLIVAAKTAIELNPANAPGSRRVVDHLILEPEHLAVMTSKYWGIGGIKLGVYFMDVRNTALQNKILSHMNAWSDYGNIKFYLSSSNNAEIRIATQHGQGYYSYLGTDILHIPTNECTMNLDNFSLNTPDSEYKRVVRHETGHTLGYPHEHLRHSIIQKLDRKKTIAYFKHTQGWSEQEVIAQVLTSLEDSGLIETSNADTLSIMCYQLPGEITIDGQPITGGNDIDQSDGILTSKLYPKNVVSPPINPTKLFSLNFKTAVPINGLVKFNALKPIPVGLVDLVLEGNSNQDIVDV